MVMFDTKDRWLNDGIESGSTKEDEDRKEELRLSGKFDTIKEAIGTIEKNGPTIHFLSAGAWSMHDLLAYILETTGPAEVKAFTFAWGPDASRTIINLQKQGKITKLWIVLNSVMRRWTVSAIETMKHHSEKISLLPMHAKGFLLENDNWKICVTGSANFSNNQSVENGNITQNEEIFELHRKWVDAALSGESDFNRIVSRNIEPPEMPPPDENEKVLFLIRGLPGCGKSTLAAHIADAVFENDTYFYSNGKYDFHKDELDWAIGECVSATRRAMESGLKKIAVSNTFSNPDHLKVYYEMASVYGYTVFCMVAENRHGGKNIHDVPTDVIEGMKKRFKVRL